MTTTEQLALQPRGTSSTPLILIGPPPLGLVQRLGAKVPDFPIDPSWAEHLPAMEAELFTLVNADRRAAGLAPYFRDPLLDQIALWKAMQMGWAQYMDHADHAPPIDRVFGSRFVDFGYVRGIGYDYAFAENLAYGWDSAAGVEHAWMSDSGHRNNILGQALGIGIGIARTTTACRPGGTPMPGLIFFAQDFGTKPQDVPGPTGSPAPTGVSGTTGSSPTGSTATTGSTERKPQAGEIWVRKTNSKNVVHIDRTFTTKAGVHRVAFTTVSNGFSHINTETLFMKLYKFLHV